ncbi:MAG: DNA-processing protein DprA [Filifactoraceae bacterium]
MEELCLFLDFLGLSFNDTMEFISKVEKIDGISNLCDEKFKELFSEDKGRLDKFLERRKFFNDFKVEMHEKEIGYLCFFDEKYPKKLKSIDNPPLVLYYKGNIELMDTFGIGVIGSRKPSVYGSYIAKDLSEKLANAGVTIISGMAMGIDGIAHRSAIDSNGNTIAVLGTGFNYIYPKTNKRLYEDILDKGGLVISENHHKKSILPQMFMFRNRIISGIGDGLLVVEAGLKSGTMTTVDFGLNQGKVIFAVPGNINSPLSIGTNTLIKNGGVIVTNVKDIFDEFPNVKFNDKKIKTIDHRLSEIELTIVSVLKEKGSVYIESLAYITNINIKDLSGVLNILEIKGIVSELGNKLYTYIE